MQSSNVNLADRVALVTGGGRGIGRAIALSLSRAGATVAVLARSAAELDSTSAEINEHGGRALALPAAVDDPRAVQEALDVVVATRGPVEILINNAAVVWPLGPATKVSFDEWESALAINVTAAVRLAFMVLPAMLEAGWGRIVNVSSGVAANPTGMVGANAYATTKAALEAHTLNLAAELAGTGVTVNAFRPGSVDTAMQAWIRAQDPGKIGRELHARFMASHRTGSLLTPGESAASLLVRLGGEDTGSVWSANGSSSGTTPLSVPPTYEKGDT